MAGKAYKQDTRVHKIFRTATEQRKVFFGNTEVFSSAHDVAYHIDVNNVVMLEIEDETDIISQAPPATKTGWTFVGWRQDTVASSDVLTELLATEDDMHVYAVFSMPITVSLVGGESVIYNTGTRYYNNSVYNNPWITLGYAQKTGWLVTGYRYDTVATGDVTFTPGSNYEFSQDTTLYAIFQQDVILRVTALGTLTEYPAIRYENNGNYNNPTIYVSDPALDDADFDGYSDDPDSIVVVDPTLSTGITIDRDTYRYAVWTYHDAILDTTYRRVYTNWGAGTMDVTAFDVTKYKQLAVTAACEVVVAGWAIENNALVFIGNTWYMTGHWGDPIGTYIEVPTPVSTWWSGEDGNIANAAAQRLLSEEIAVTTSYMLQVRLQGDVGPGTTASGVTITKIEGIGRTIVY